jgi:hypothetical protein
MKCSVKNIPTARLGLRASAHLAHSRSPGDGWNLEKGSWEHVQQIFPVIRCHF